MLLGPRTKQLDLAIHHQKARDGAHISVLTYTFTTSSFRPFNTFVKLDCTNCSTKKLRRRCLQEIDRGQLYSVALLSFVRIEK